MKISIGMRVVGVVFIAVLALSVCNGRPAAAGNQGPMASTSPSPTDVVVDFYRVLMSEHVTAEDEARLLAPSSLIAIHLGATRSIPQDGASVIEYLRSHRDLFIPKMGTIEDEIQVSSPFTFTRSLSRVKSGEREIQVMALFILDNNIRPNKIRSIFFRFKEGKIDADGIYFDSVLGESTLGICLQGK